MNDYKDLEVWKRAVNIVTDIYKITSGFPDSEKFGLTTQIRRAAISIPSNIAEGSARHHSGDFTHFLRIADGSAAEVETQIIIACNLDFIDCADELIQEIKVIRRMLAALIRSLKK